MLNNLAYLKLVKENDFKQTKYSKRIMYPKQKDEVCVVYEFMQKELDVGPVKQKQHQNGRIKYYYIFMLFDEDKTSNSIYQTGQEFNYIKKNFNNLSLLQSKTSLYITSKDSIKIFKIQLLKKQQKEIFHIFNWMGQMI
ncbi:unnamed protein product [Paramecium octaurelia]|uniref:Uncharacterized protein n=1 Tax=Paramecium octaurelia TaxID=43137 RepID=A0A8S1UG72_PAROT|nr:unnamed protein product [Paramecium octaurelia]